MQLVITMKSFIQYCTFTKLRFAYDATIYSDKQKTKIMIKYYL